MNHFNYFLSGDTTDTGSAGCLEMKLTTASYGSEISWTLDSCQSNSGYGDNNEYTQQCCLEPGNYNLECKDSYGDGWNGGYIEVDGKKYCDGFTSGTEETNQIIVQGSGKYYSYFASIVMGKRLLPIPTLLNV